MIAIKIYKKFFFFLFDFFLFSFRYNKVWWLWVFLVLIFEILNFTIHVVFYDKHMKKDGLMTVIVLKYIYVVQCVRPSEISLNI